MAFIVSLHNVCKECVFVFLNSDISDLVSLCYKPAAKPMYQVNVVHLHSPDILLHLLGSCISFVSISDSYEA